MKLTFEHLESRRLCASGASLSAGVLSVNGTNRDDVIETVQVGSDIQVRLNGQVQSFASADVQSIVIDGKRGDDVITQRVQVPAVIKGGDGNDNLTGFGSADALYGNDGRDTLYAIVGAPGVRDGGSGFDKIIAKQTDTVISGEVVAKFGPRLPVQLENGTLYLTGDDAANRFVVSERGRDLVVSFDGQVQTFRKRDVKFIAGLGGAGDDTFINDTSIDSVVYGTGGNDTLVGGRGRDILKGGAGDDVVLGLDGDDDLAGDSGDDLLVAGRGRNIVRFDALDFVFASRWDLLLMS